MVYQEPTFYGFENYFCIELFLGEWWKEDVMEVLQEFVTSGGAPRVSDAYTINGQPGDLYPCSSQGQFSNFTYMKTQALMNNLLSRFI